MGIENNNAVLATTWNDNEVSRLTKWIETLPNHLADLFAVVPAIANGKATIVLCPDGSNEGWDVSDTVDDLRQEFIHQLANNKENGDSYWEWIEVGYGEYGQKILRGNNENVYNEQEYYDGTVT